MTFGEAWVEAIQPGRAIVMTTAVGAPELAIRWPTDRTDREAWRTAIQGSREAWRRAFYAMEPSPAEQALASLGESFSVLDRAAAIQAEREGIAVDRHLVSAA